MAKCFPQFEHNYNQVSRELMYNWFNKHLQLGQLEPVVEKPFEPVPPRELSVYDDQHPRPKDATDANGLRKHLTEASEKQLEHISPKYSANLKEFKNLVGNALSVMIHSKLTQPSDVESRGGGKGDEEQIGDVRLTRFRVGRKGMDEEIPAIMLIPKNSDDRVVIWIHPKGKSSLFEHGKLVPAARWILDNRAVILSPDLFLTGEFHAAKTPAVNDNFAGYTFGYNKPLLANRVCDILRMVGLSREPPISHKFYLISFAQAGPWVLLARGLCGDAVTRTAIDANQFDFDQVKTTSDEMVLPGALKYGGMASFAAICAPGELYLHNVRTSPRTDWIKDAYQAAGATDKLKLQTEKAPDEKVIEWLLR